MVFGQNILKNLIQLFLVKYYNGIRASKMCAQASSVTRVLEV